MREELGLQIFVLTVLLLAATALRHAYIPFKLMLSHWYRYYLGSLVFNYQSIKIENNNNNNNGIQSASGLLAYRWLNLRH